MSSFSDHDKYIVVALFRAQTMESLWSFTAIADRLGISNSIDTLLKLASIDHTTEEQYDLLWEEVTNSDLDIIVDRIVWADRERPCNIKIT